MKNFRILYLEDSPHDAELAGYILKNAGIDFTLKLVDTQDEYQHALEEYRPDIILADHSLFHFNSSEALKIFKSTGLKIPFILVTGTVSEEFAVDILKEGADDYLLKNNLARLPNAILNSLEKYRLDRERQEYLNNIIANEALMKEAEQLALFGSWEADIITGEFKWSDEIFRIYGYEPGEIKPGQDIVLHHIHPEDRTFYQQALFSIMKQQDTYASEIRIIDRNGQNKFVSFKIVVKRNKSGQLARLLGFVQDITQKKELEKELAEQALRQQRLITEVTIQAQEKERNELGKELHDNINQVLATVKIFLNMSLNNPLKSEEFTNRGIHNINYAIEEIRKLSKTLVAPSLGEIGLIEALKDLVHEQNFDINLKAQLVAENRGEKDIDKNMELMLYRIAQEQLNNIRKYAKASNAIIALRIEAERLFFSIADDGVGFNPHLKARGIGLKNISSRIDFYEGKMDIISSPGMGCRLELSIPL
ncbi:MAG: putative signal transduction histidine kinase [Chitinophagaceae bacterium]|nr:putative signal transduction histidine kinase [Chitinophagaceae bacterium]